MSDPFSVVIEEQARLSNWRLHLQFNDFEVKLSRDNAVDLATHLVDAIERKMNSKSSIGGDAGWKLTVSVYNREITIQRWDPIAHTATASLTESQAKDLIHELVVFSEAASS